MYEFQFLNFYDEPTYTLLKLRNLENPKTGPHGKTVTTSGIFDSFETAYLFVREERWTEFAIASFGILPQLLLWAYGENVPFPEWEMKGEEDFFYELDQQISENYDPASRDEDIPMEIPIKFLTISHIYSDKVKALTPEQGAQIANYNPDQQTRTIKRSPWYDKQQMYLTKHPQYCYRVENHYLGDLLTISPKPYGDADVTTPRVPMCRKLPSCAASAARAHNDYFIYMSMQPLITVLPSSNLVYDAPITGERWVIPPKHEVNFICVGTAGIETDMADVAFLGDPITASEFVTYGGGVQSILVDIINNEHYFEVMEADQQQSGVTVEVDPYVSFGL